MDTVVLGILTSAFLQMVSLTKHYLRFFAHIKNMEKNLKDFQLVDKSKANEELK